MSANSAGAYTATLLVMINVIKRGWACTPHLPGLILPSSLNVRQKAAVATLCTLWVEITEDFFRRDVEFPTIHVAFFLS